MPNVSPKKNDPENKLEKFSLSKINEKFTLELNVDQSMKKKYYNKIQNVQTLNEYKFSIKKII
jgi:hypothetical protein